MPHFVKVIFVQLADEAGEVAMFEVFREDVFREFLVLAQSQYVSIPSPTMRKYLKYNEAISLVSPAYYAFVLRAFQHSMIAGIST